MADYVIKVSTDELRSLSDKFSSQRTVMENYMTEMNSKINELGPYFKSDAGNEFVEKYNTVSNDIKACLDNLQSEITSLRTAAGIFDEKDKETAVKTGNLSTTSVFRNK